MDIQLKKLSDLLSQLNTHVIIINNIIYEMNIIFNENSNNNNKDININLNSSINSLNDCLKKVNQNNYNNINLNLNTSLETLDKDGSNNIFLNNKISVIFRNLGKEINYIYDRNTPINKILRVYLEDTGSLRMPKKPIFLYKGTSLNPNDKRKIGDLSLDEIEIIVDFF